jgi:rod shape-determining protein MreD
MPPIVYDTLLSLLCILFQTTLVRFLGVGDIVPDIPLLWIVYLGIRRGQIPATVAGFFIGLLLDLLSGADGLLGLAALAKTAGGFLAGYFFNETRTQQTLSSYGFLTAVLIVSLVHHALYFLILLQGTEITVAQTFLRYGLPTALYTTVAALFPMFVFSRHYRL